MNLRTPSLPALLLCSSLVLPLVGCGPAAEDSLQGDAAFPGVLKQMGCTVITGAPKNGDPTTTTRAWSPKPWSMGRDGSGAAGGGWADSMEPSRAEPSTIRTTGWG